MFVVLLALGCEPKPEATGLDSVSSTDRGNLDSNAGGDTGSGGQDSEDSGWIHTGGSTMDTALPDGHHGSQSLLLSAVDGAAEDCSGGFYPTALDLTLVASCGSDLIRVVPRSAEVTARVVSSKAPEYCRGLGGVGDLDGDGALDVHCYEAGTELGSTVLWGPVEGTNALEDLDSMALLPQGDLRVGGSLAVVQQDDTSLQWVVPVDERYLYNDGRAVVFSAESRASSLESADGVASIESVDELGVDWVVDGGDVDGDGITDIVTRESGYLTPYGWSMGSAFSIHLGPVTGAVRVDAGYAYMQGDHHGGMWIETPTVSDGDIDGDGYGDALVGGYVETSDGFLDVLCPVSGGASAPGELPTCVASDRIVEGESDEDLYDGKLHDLDGDGRAELVLVGEDGAGTDAVWILSGPVSGTMSVPDSARSRIVPSGDYTRLSGLLEVLTDESGPVLALSGDTDEAHRPSDLVFLDLAGL